MHVQRKGVYIESFDPKKFTLQQEVAVVAWDEAVQCQVDLLAREQS
jgi:hypothetical protein